MPLYLKFQNYFQFSQHIFFAFFPLAFMTFLHVNYLIYPIYFLFLSWYKLHEGRNVVYFVHFIPIA